MRRWAAAVCCAALACSPPPPAKPPRHFTALHTCKVTGSAFGAAALGSDLVVSEFEVDRLVQLEPATCAEKRHWNVPGGPRAIARVGDAFAVVTSTGLTFAALDGGTASLALSPAPNALLSSGGKLFATTGATAAEARVVEVDGLTVVADVPLTGASSLAVDGAGLIANRFTEGKQTRLALPGLAVGEDLAVCAEPFSATSFGSTLVTTCRAGGLELRTGADRRTLPRDGALYDTVAEDLDGDGRIDLASVDPFAHALVFWWGATDGGFDPPEVQKTDKGPILLRSFDFDMDGRPELWVLAFQDRSVTVFRNEGTR